MTSSGGIVLDWESVDQLAMGEVRVVSGTGHWPSMVNLELDGPGCDGFGFTMTAEDAKLLARKLNVCANLALGENGNRGL